MSATPGIPRTRIRTLILVSNWEPIQHTERQLPSSVRSMRVGGYGWSSRPLSASGHRGFEHQRPGPEAFSPVHFRTPFSDFVHLLRIVSGVGLKTISDLIEVAF